MSADIDPMLQGPEEAAAYKKQVEDLMRRTIEEDRERRRNAPVVEDSEPVMLGMTGFTGGVASAQS